jgi:hypothetical protein
MQLSSENSMDRVTTPLAVLLVVSLFASCTNDALTGPNPAVDNLGYNPGELPLTAAAAFPGGIDQLLVNGDIEDDVHGVWWTGRSSGYSLAATTEQYVSATHSLSISSDYDHGDDNFTFWAQTVPLANLGGTKFTLSVSLKLDQIGGEGIAIAIRGDVTDPPSGVARAFATTQGRAIFAGSSDWATVQVDLQDIQDNVGWITVYLIYLPHSTGTAYFDDVKLSVGEGTPILSLQNGTVEDGAYHPEYWWSGGYAGFDFDWSTDYSVSPSHSLRIENRGAAESAYAFWAQTIKADAYVGRALTLSASVRLDGADGNGIALAIRGDDTLVPAGYAELFTTTQGNVQINGSREWTAYSVTVASVPSNIKSLTVYLIHLHGTRGTVYFDDISLDPS